MNTNPCGVRIASLTSPCFISKARSATAGAMTEPGDWFLTPEERRFVDGQAAGLGDGIEIAGIVDLVVELVGDALRLRLSALPLDLILDLGLDLVERARRGRLAVGQS